MPTPQETGAAHEEAFARRVGGKLTPQSGAGWKVKLDVGAGQWVFSCKATKHASISVTDAMLAEMLDYAVSVGIETVAALAVELNSGGPSPRRLIVMDENDWLAMARGEVEATLPTPAERAEQKIARTKLPGLLRGE